MPTSWEKSGPLFNPNLAPNTLIQVKKQLSSAGEVLLEALVSATPEGATSGLKRGWVVNNNGLTVEVVNDTPYILAVELGRKAAWVPIKPLVAWVEKKLGVSGKAALGVAFAISKKKSTSVTPGQHFAEKTLVALTPKLQSMMRTITFTP